MVGSPLPTAKPSPVGSSLGPLALPGLLLACPQFWSSPFTTLPFIIPGRVPSIAVGTLTDTVVYVQGIFNHVRMPRTTVTTNSPRSQPRFTRPWPRDFRILWRSQWTRYTSCSHPVRVALRILDKEKSDHSGHIWNEGEKLVWKCFLIKWCWSYDMKS